MVMLNNFGRSISRKIDLRLALNERTLLERCSQRVQDDLPRHRLSMILGAMDDQLLDRLVEQGFDSENLDALRYAPIAEVAWASGRVTHSERVFAVTAALSSDMLGMPAAFGMFQSWLEKRPDPALWSLWEDYIIAQLDQRRETQDEEFGRHLYEVALRVALASGGLLDQGEICVTEQRVLDRLARIYRLGSEKS